MECYDPVSVDESADPSRKIVWHSNYQPKLSPWFDLRVFYVRVSNCEVDEFTPEYLTLNHIPLSPDTLLEVNGTRSSMYSEGVSSLLRRDRVDKKSEEATFVSTDNIRMTGSVKFEVYDRDDLLLSGVLEMSNSNGFIGESKNHSKQWTMNCQSEVTAGTGFLRGKQYMGSESLPPTVEVYIAGCFSGTAIILTKTLQLSFRKKHTRRGMLDSIPEYETTESKTEVPSELALQVDQAIMRWEEIRFTRLRIRVKRARRILMVIRIKAGDVLLPIKLSNFQDYKQENDDDDYHSLYSRGEYIEGEDGELSWFNAGVRVGVGIGLGICVGIGIGVGLLVRTYQATTRNFKRRLP